ncbi:MAG: radical SAM protein [Bacteroidota bacterium]
MQEIEESAVVKNIESLPFYLNEIFYSIQGEGTRAGMPCVFVRLHGCKLRCSYCDTKYAIDHRRGGIDVTAGEIIEKVRSYNCNFVEFTGGEPLEQEATFELMKYFCDKGFEVAVETGGHIDTERVDERVIKIIDMKTPGSKMVTLNNYKNLDLLKAHDEVKFVLDSREDYEWAQSIVLKHDLVRKTAAVLFSAVFGKINLQELAEWILKDNTGVRMQLQMHKYIWDPNARGV